MSDAAQGLMLHCQYPGKVKMCQCWYCQHWHPKLEWCCHMTLAQFWAHIVRVQQIEHCQYVFGVVGLSQCQCLHPKLEWSCHLTLTQFWIHQVRMQQIEPSHHVL